MAQTITVKMMYEDSGYYFIDADEADQGAAGSGLSVKDVVDAVGASKSATMIFGHTGAGNTTTYTFSTNETITDNFDVIVENGAIIAVDTGITVTCSASFNAPIQQVISLAGTGAFNFGTKVKIIPNEWYGNTGTCGLLGDVIATKAYNAPSIPAGLYAAVSWNNITGVVLGDHVISSFDIDVQNLIIDTRVIATDTVEVTLYNNTAGAIDLGLCNIDIMVMRSDI